MGEEGRWKWVWVGRWKRVWVRGGWGRKGWVGEEGNGWGRRVGGRKKGTGKGEE